MTMDIKSLRSTRNNNNFDKIVQGIQSQTNKSYDDKRFWSPTTDKAGNASAVIRFLPTTDGDELPWIRYWSHSFKNAKNGRWYIENSRTSIKEADPLGELNSEDYNSGDDNRKKEASDRKRKLNFVANIYVVSDPKNPEAEGKVFLFKFGKTIFDKITGKIEPKFEDDKPVFVYDFWEGANFKFRKTIKDEWPNYDDSVFEGVTELVGGDEEKLLEIANAQYRLSEFIDPKNFKTYDELKKKLDYVLGKTGTPTQTPTAENIDFEDDFTSPSLKSKPEAEIASKPEHKQSKPAVKPMSKPLKEEADETEDYFKSLTTSGFDAFEDDIPF